VIKLGRTGELVLNQPGTTTVGTAQATTAQALKGASASDRSVRNDDPALHRDG